MKRILAIMFCICWTFPCLGQYRQAHEGKIILETKASFPVGFYHISHYGTQDAKRISDMVEIKKLGANYIATPIDANDAATIQKAKELDLGLMLEYNDHAPAVLEAFKDSKNIFAHIPGDDVDLKFANAAAYQLKENEYKALRGDLLTLASNAMALNGAKFAGISDKTGQQCYPIPNEPLSAVNWCYERTKAALDEKGMPFVAHVQTSRWAGKRYPTAQEFTAMAWGAVAFGANEILFYTFFDYGSGRVAVTDLATQTGLRSAIKDFISKLRTIEHYLIRGNRTTTKNGSGVSAVFDYPALDSKLTISINYNTKVVSVLEGAR